MGKFKFKPTLDNDLGRIARRAAAIIKQRGWTRGVEENAAGQVCIIGGFRLAVSPVWGEQNMYIRQALNRRFTEWLRENYQGPYLNWAGEPVKLDTLFTTPAWNDQIFTCEEEALAWLNKFADDLDPQR